MFYEGNDYYYPKTIAGKTGYTDEALNTLVSCATDDNLELISVVLKTHGKNVYPDSVNLLEYGLIISQNIRLRIMKTPQILKKLIRMHMLYFRKM